jgi:hypothetical protein
MDIQTKFKGEIESSAHSGKTTHVGMDAHAERRAHAAIYVNVSICNRMRFRHKNPPSVNFRLLLIIKLVRMVFTNTDIPADLWLFMVAIAVTSAITWGGVGHARRQSVNHHECFGNY